MACADRGEEAQGARGADGRAAAPKLFTLSGDLTAMWHTQIEEKKRKEREALLAAPPPAPATKEAPSAFGAARRPGAPSRFGLRCMLMSAQVAR